ncbi:lipopolysaccharide biosynthesis protein [Pseudoflavitalea sp. X16]|uniref:lipopolysaccharide biosynthesis protein n=1 Tax=Paraflavitalea devenefica TaxID=2716334 RepID=UPI00141E0E7A|nr:lipopolysaccharide biosynthesis protein [Paraflavitalea devenefica]NII29559.1 lipopolysaccharide biosynthesis protein [Paraflavitalea devenefica]
MGEIRKQTLQSSFLSYIGFLVGAINTYFFTREGMFTPEQYGLTQVIISLSQIIAPFASLGMTAFMNRFFPYYADHLDHRKNDMLTVVILFCSLGALVIFSGCIVFEPFVVRQFSGRSPLVVTYYYWMLFFSFFYLWFLVFESYLGTLKKTVLPGFMRETGYRLCVLVLIGLYAFGVIDFSLFVKLFCCIYLLVVLILVSYLIWIRRLYVPTTFSKVTRRIRKSVWQYVAFVYTGLTINGIARQIDTLSLAGAKSLHDTGIYSLNQYLAAILQVPLRGLQAIAGPLIAEHWKNKNYPELRRIYERSSINLLLIACFLFFNIWLNYDDGLQFLHIDQKFAAGKMVFLILGLCNILELGAGINGAMLSTSPGWRFEFYSGLTLLLFSIPLNIYMARWRGMEGVALASLTTITLYNTIRLIFMHYRFNMSPFTIKTVYALLLVGACYLLTWLLLHNIHGFVGIAFRSVMFSSLLLGGILYLRLTPDLPQFIEVVKKKLGKKG